MFKNLKGSTNFWFLGCCRREYLKSFSYFWASDMAPTYSLPGLYISLRVSKIVVFESLDIHVRPFNMPHCEQKLHGQFRGLGPVVWRHPVAPGQDHLQPNQTGTSPQTPRGQHHLCLRVRAEDSRQILVSYQEYLCNLSVNLSLKYMSGKTPLCCQPLLLNHGKI